MCRLSRDNCHVLWFIKSIGIIFYRTFSGAQRTFLYNTFIIARIWNSKMSAHLKLEINCTRISSQGVLHGIYWGKCWFLFGKTTQDSWRLSVLKLIVFWKETRRPKFYEEIWRASFYVHNFSALSENKQYF